MTLTRDSAALTIAAILAALAYLGTMPPPTEWTYQQWLQTAMAAVMWISGKLSSSWLKGAEPKA
jgi:hypothetical protein